MKYSKTIQLFNQTMKTYLLFIIILISTTIFGQTNRPLDSTLSTLGINTNFSTYTTIVNPQYIKELNPSSSNKIKNTNNTTSAFSTDVLLNETFDASIGAWFTYAYPDNKWILNTCAGNGPSSIGTHAVYVSMGGTKNNTCNKPTCNHKYQYQDAGAFEIPSTQYTVLNIAIDARCYTQMFLTFDYISGGNSGDYFNLVYSLNNGITWIPFSTNSFGVTTWATTTVALPLVLNRTQFLLGFQFTYNNDGLVNNPPSAVDNINLTGLNDMLPTFSYTCSPCIGTSNSFNFDASGWITNPTTPTQPTITSYSWSFNTATPSTANTNIVNGVNYTSFGSDEACLAVTDNYGCIENYCQTFNVSNALPIQLLDFSGKYNKVVTLNWSTASETNNNYFTIERMTNGTPWNKIDTIKGANNSTTQINYSTIDSNPINGVDYYRLKQTDFDGNYTLSNVIAINVTPKQENSLTIIPNPTFDIAKIILNSNFIGNYNLSIYDYTGRLIEMHLININFGINTISLNILNYKPGFYYICINNGSQLYSNKLIKE